MGKPEYKRATDIFIKLSRFCQPQVGNSYGVRAGKFNIDMNNPRRLVDSPAESESKRQLLIEKFFSNDL